MCYLLFLKAAILFHFILCCLWMIFPTMINFANILMYADDVNDFLFCNNFIEHVYLQGDLNNFFLWFDILELNIKKWKCMRLSRYNFISVNYLFVGQQVQILDSFIDLGILLNTKLNFNGHITLNVNKVRSTFGFIKQCANTVLSHILSHLFIVWSRRCLVVKPGFEPQARH